MGYDLRRWGCRGPGAGWQLDHGIGGKFTVEWVATLVWNPWQFSCGMGGNFAMEPVATLPWNGWQLSRGIRKPGFELPTNDG